MILVYISYTGNVRKFVERTDMESFELNNYNSQTKIDDTYIMIVPTYGDSVDSIANDFIKHQEDIDNLIGFVGSGNRNFNSLYVYNAKNLSKQHNKPMLFSFELSGTDEDVKNFKKEVCQIEHIFRTKQ